MSNDSTITKELSLMGFGDNHIARALRIYRKNYGNNKYNVSVLTELIIRLQRKDKVKRHSEPYTRSDRYPQILPPLPLALPSKSNVLHPNSKANRIHKRKPNAPANPIPISHSQRKRHSAITTSLPAKTLKLFQRNKRHSKHSPDHPHPHSKRTKRKSKHRVKPIIIDDESIQTVIIHHDADRPIPTISDDISELHTPPLPLYSSNKRMNGRDFKRMMASDDTVSTDLDSPSQPTLPLSSRDRMSSDDTENKKAMHRPLMDEYSLSSPPTHNSDDAMDDILTEDVFQQQSQRILIQNRKRYSLQPMNKTKTKQIVPKRKSESMRTYNTLDVPLFKELESTFGAFNGDEDAQSPPRPKLKHQLKPRRRRHSRSIRIQKARNGNIKVFTPKHVQMSSKRRQSDPTTSSNGVWNSNHDPWKHMEDIKKRCNVMNDEQIINKIIGSKEYKLWDLNNDRVDLYHVQCRNVCYQDLVPSLYDVMYPTALSSVVLPPSLCSSKDQYKVNVFLDVETFTNCKVETSTESYKNKTHFTFDAHTTAQQMIDGLLDDIKSDIHIHQTMMVEWDTLHSMCFMLKVDGREEFLKYNDNHTIIQSNYVRECIRNGDNNKLQFILIYVSGLAEYNDSEYRADLALKPSASGDDDALQYENMGFNVIFNALLQETKEDAPSFDVFTACIQKEAEWLSHKVGRTAQCGGGDKPDYHSMDRAAILLSEFEHPIEITICNVLNITSCPRYKAEEHYFLLLRMELMFGNQVYSECCWDIRIPSDFVDDEITIPYPICNLVSGSGSSAKPQLTYALLPRECVWNITIYGVQKDKKRESEMKTQQKKMKNAPKLITRSTPSMINLNFNIKSSYDYTEMAIGSGRTRLESTAQRITASPICNQEIVANNNNNNTTEESSKYIPEAIAWCRLPLINDKHCLHKGRHTIDLWPIPLHKSDAKDPYATKDHIWKQFGATYPHYHDNDKPISITIQFFFDAAQDDRCSTDDDYDDDAMSSSAPTTQVHSVAQGFKFDIVAPIVNPRRDASLLADVQPFTGKDNRRDSLLSSMISNDNCDGLLSERDKLLISSHKSKLMRCGDDGSLYSYLSSVHWRDAVDRMESYDYLSKWAVPSKEECIARAICLLKHNFADNHIRLYAVSQLHKLDDFTLHKYLFQLIEALKVEIHHSSFLSRFLMFRALANPYQIGHFIFWYMKAQLFVNVWYYERFALFIEEYLLRVPRYVKHNLFKQYELVNKLKIISSQMRSIHKSKSKSKMKNKSMLKKERKEVLSKQLMLLNTMLFGNEDGGPQNGIQFPLNPLIKIKRFEISKCCMLSNKKIRLTFVTDGTRNNTVSAIFKYGDQLTYDVLTSNLLAIIDMFWLKHNIDLKFKTYSAIQMGSKTGFVRVASDQDLVDGATNAKKAIHHMFKQNENNCDYKTREVYARSLAAYCVVTWILGITTPLPPNKAKHCCKNIIQISNNGQLFYVNFAHLLYKSNDTKSGKTKTKLQSPFLFSNVLKFPMNNRVLYQQFQLWMFDAFCLLRSKYQLFHNLLTLSSYAPISQQKIDIAQYVRTQLKQKLRLVHAPPHTKNNCYYDKRIKIHIKHCLQSALNHKSYN